MEKIWNGLMHGADYNPEQWIDSPDIWDEDIRLMKLAGCNTATIGIFSWSSLEPEEGRFDFSWMDAVFEKLHAHGIRIILATPSAGKPQWLMNGYPEVMRVSPDRIRVLPGQRINHCLTSPVFRDKIKKLNRKLADRYGRHPALIMWHVSNELSYECHCDLCQDAFRSWLRGRYVDLSILNRVWWTSFWSHTFTDWAQIQSPSPHGENLIHGLNLDWRRFVTDQMTDYIRDESEPLRELSPRVPVTTNLMPGDLRLNPQVMAEVLDVVSLDMYPAWKSGASDIRLAAENGFYYDLYRSVKKRPFILMETTPSVTNWMSVNKQKRPGLHRLAGLQTIAHGSDSVLYFQWRKSRGGYEKFHGAVVDHSGHEYTRVFREVADLGATLAGMPGVAGAQVEAEVAIIYDWENAWAIEDAGGPRENKDYRQTCIEHYRAFWKQGIAVDVISMDTDFSGYRLIVAPMLYMNKPGVVERLERFVQEGGQLVMTYWSGIVDEHDLCHLGGFPGPLRPLLGLWVEETDTLHDGETNCIKLEAGFFAGGKSAYSCGFICEVVHLESAVAVGTYDEDYYAGKSAITINGFGRGQAYYLATRMQEDFLDDLYRSMAAQLRLKHAIRAVLPEGVTAQRRGSYIFLSNFLSEAQAVELMDEEFEDVHSGKRFRETIELQGYEVKVLMRDPNKGGHAQ
jgi:beta-galactosidase